MLIDVEWVPAKITVPKSYLTPLGGVFYGLDVNQLRLDLGTLYASQDGGPFPQTHVHQAPFVLSGIAYDRFVKVLDPYIVEIEDGPYRVSCTGANHNLADVQVVTGSEPSLIVNNSAGRTIETRQYTEDIMAIVDEVEAVYAVMDEVEDERLEEITAMVDEVEEVTATLDEVEDVVATLEEVEELAAYMDEVDT